MKAYPAKAFFNRELSWLQFNDRVLREGDRSDVPLFERARFIGIFASNLDEFYQVRVSGLLDIQGAKQKKKDASGLNVKNMLKGIRRHVKRSNQLQLEIYNRWQEIAADAGRPHIKIESLSKKKKALVKRYFTKHVLPGLAPMTWNESLSQFADLRLYLLVGMKKGKMGIVQMPPLMDRLIDGRGVLGKEGFLLADELIRYFVSDLFPDHTIQDAAWFRVTRSAALQVEVEEAADLVLEMEQALIKRIKSRIVRLEVESDQEWALEFLREILKVKKRLCFSVDGPLDLSVLQKFGTLYKGEKGFYPDLKPHERNWWQGDLFEAIRKKDRIHAVPYESMQPVVKFLRQAAEDPDVISIWQVLYRVSEDSQIVESLRRAALRGKQVTVFVELRARFDEANNLYWARALEEAGCQVIYGHPSYKMHVKAILLARKENGGIRSYLHLGTGNYNEKTARFYTDLGLFTANPALAEDAMQVLQYLAGAIKLPRLNVLSAAPFDLRETLMTRISETIHAANRGEPAWIFLKMNGLVDPGLIKSLYEASQAGVKVDCLVRGICCLRPGVPGLSENIQVRSIIGRFLEHQRIFYFARRDKERLYLSSADWIPRNLNRRIETLFPVDDREARETIKGWMRLQWQDRCRAHELKRDGSYQSLNGGIGSLDSQASLIGGRKE